MISLHYTCKFCRKPGFVHGDEAGMIMANQMKWLSSVACDRCGTYMAKKRSLCRAIQNACSNLIILRASRNPKRDEIEAVVLQNLITTTKILSQIVCNYYRVTNIWEPDFAQMIFDNPNKLSTIIGTYIRGVAHESRNTHDNTRTTVEAPAEHRETTEAQIGLLPEGA